MEMRIFCQLEHIWEKKIRPGDIYYGYDLTALIMNHDLEDICAVSKIPDYVLVKKKFKRKNNKKRIWKLRHLAKADDPMVFRRKNEDEKEKQYEEFLRDIEENKEMRKNINIYKDDQALKDLEKQFDNLGVKGKQEDDDDEDSEIDIKVDELLSGLNINDKEEEEKDRKDSEDIGAVETEQKDEENIPNTKLIGKRERTGENL